jgi:protein-S-isoprenylcysteine O-methyltransferase Ste14
VHIPHDELIFHGQLRDTQLVPRTLRRLLLPAAMLELADILEGAEIVRQQRRGADRSLLASASDRDPASVRLLALTWWPAGIAALAEAAWLPRADVSRTWARPCLVAGIAVTGTGIALRQWAIHTLGQYFVGHVLVQPGQTAISTGPYRWLRHPSYTGQWLEMTGIGLATGNVASIATCVLVPLIGITSRINGEERELTASLPGYRDYIQGRPRLIPHIW